MTSHTRFIFSARIVITSILKQIKDSKCRQNSLCKSELRYWILVFKRQHSFSQSVSRTHHIYHMQCIKYIIQWGRTTTSSTIIDPTVYLWTPGWQLSPRPQGFVAWHLSPDLPGRLHVWTNASHVKPGLHWHPAQHLSPSFCGPHFGINHHPLI